MSRALLEALGLAALVLAGCGGAALDRVRYVNAEPVTEVAERDIPDTPDVPAEAPMLERYDALVHRPLVQATQLRTGRLARDINALGEVPDSSWFTDRSPSPGELRRGPNTGPGPEARKPWTVVQSKAVGVAPGFIIEDAAGDRYLLKLDLAGAPETESGAHIVVHRLLWALGYFVPEDRVVTLRRGDLVVADDAVVKGELEERPMTRADVAAVLELGHVNPDGTIRALASKFVPGEPLGGFADSGTRDGDPNDTIAHQHRRSLRGLYPVFAWLKHTDVKRANTLDAYIEDPETGRRIVRHYLIDFGKALGVLTRVSDLHSDGYARWFDFADAAKSTVTAGLYERPWDGLELPRYRGLGFYEIEGYDPGGFEVRFPWQPFVEADERDMLWAVKRMMRLTPEHIRAAVDAARYSDPAAARYLTRALIARQRATARYWMRRSNPIDRLAARRAGGGLEVCFDDLVRRHRLASAAVLDETRYAIAVYDYAGRRLEYRPALTRDTETGRLCARDVPAGADRGGYTIVAIDTVRPGTSHEPVLVHIAFASDSGTPRVIGVRRLD